MSLNYIYIIGSGAGGGEAVGVVAPTKCKAWGPPTVMIVTRQAPFRYLQIDTTAAR